MSNPKAIFFDLDGTLLSMGKLTESAKEALRYAKEKGVLVFVATGRHRNEFESMPWFPSVSFDGFVTMNGAYCYADDKVVFKSPIGKDAIRKVAKYLTNNPYYCMFCEANDIYANISDPSIESKQLSIGLKIPAVRDPMKAIDADIFQLVFIGNGLHNHMEQLPQCTITSWAEGCYDVVRAGINKWVGILPMLDRFGLKPQDVAAVGDGQNDIEMLVGAGYSVAMGNGIDKVKECADYVTSHVDDGGSFMAVKYLLG